MMTLAYDAAWQTGVHPAAVRTFTVIIKGGNDMIGRREFLKILPGFMALPLATPSPAAERTSLLFEDYIAGFQFYQGEAATRSLKQGDRLFLRREPENHYDRMAIEVYSSGGVKLGYIARAVNIIPASMLDRGVRLEVLVIDVSLPPAPSWERVRFAVYFDVAEAAWGGSN